MDPYSITVGATGLADVTLRVISYLVCLKEAYGKIQLEIVELTNEIRGLATIHESVENLLYLGRDRNTLSSPGDDGPIVQIQTRLASILQQSTGTIEQLEALLIEVVGKKGAVVTGKIDGLRKTIKKQGREDQYMRLRQHISNYQGNIQILLSSLNIYYIRQSLPAKDLAVGNFPEDLRRQITRLRIQISNLRREPRTLAGADNSHYLIDSVSAVASLIRFNEHFDIPQNVSSYYTGRQGHLNELKSILGIEELHQHQTHQKRFVISGLGGSGKTQFCCKFAQDNRENFWGVFWIDGSSSENAQRCYSEIAKIGGVEPNKNAAKNWLSGLQLPWLLLIDNADDPEIDVARYFPGGEGGVILITTRNPSTRRHGTEGVRFFHFDKLETEEASDLLLAAAVLPRPWGVPTRSHANRIAQVLGYLPLALIHAGKTVLDKLCSLSDYPEYYERTWNRIRHSRSRRASRGHDDEHASSMSVYSSYEMIYVGLENKIDQRSRDALELLKMFSFFYRENIEFNLIKTAAMNPRRERQEAQATESIEEQLVHEGPQTWANQLYSWAVAVLGPLQRGRSALPQVLWDEDDTPFDEDRLRIALSLLVRLGMVTFHDANNSYWMHPLVHTWVRQRPDTSTAEQALWCQVASTVLAQSIFLQAPRAYAGQDERFKRQIHPHVEHVRRLQKEINNRLEDNQRVTHWLWRWIWPTPWQGLQTFQAREYVKFSLVYLRCGEWAKAEELQLQVKNYIFATLGPKSKYGIDIALLLSTNYVLQTRTNEARVLQYQVLHSAKYYYGSDHPTTLRIMDTLGRTCLLCSRLGEADRLHKEVIEKLSKLEAFGPEHENYYTAVDNLAKVRVRYFDMEEAVRLQELAYKGMKRILGPMHKKTLEAQDDLAGIYGFVGEQRLPLALRMSEEVVEIRVRELGREHPETLKSKLTLAKIKTAMNQFDDAEEIFREGLPAAKRNLGETHLGTLAARTWHGHLYWRQGLYAEAATIWEDVIQKHNYEQSKRADGEHVDRVQAMWFLVHCYEDQGRIDDAIKICEEVIQLTRSFGGEGLGQQHKFWRHVREKSEELLRRRERHEQRLVADETNCRLALEPRKKVVKNFTF
ncbi:hypothetical protein JDV02_003040 [Purpureocillium takamizusanense]|uniref:NB-ARC domain-containing protein n=1 Tax=Purpureocillium takamizusanense TaxID=2060973 RepID=A0A9Q8QC99_9HYPO|nr:uncharacterized protein JDV02_003040 [Purpureocillium takamizusanense]UNI16617.1 hypothetical protein JDV02_003040 [Purpureocillium takamizusanense]